MSSTDGLFDQSVSNIVKLAKFAGDHLTQLNEATTRLHLIDTLLFDCLGWLKKDVFAELHQNRAERNEFTDYTFFAPRQIMILEAKREGTYFDLPTSKTAITYELPSLCRKESALTCALEQVAGYCQSRGVQIGVISNGHQLVAFIANRTDGIPPLKGKCVSFPSLWHMYENFTEVWNLLSREGIEDRNLERKLLGTSATVLPPPLAASIQHYPGLKGRNLLQVELKSLAETVIEDVPESPALELEFLKNCYCATGALSQHSLASKALLKARYDALFDSGSPGRPTVTPVAEKGTLASDLFVQSMSRRPILLLGTVGVGKSMFIRHFMNIDAADLIENAIAIRIDLGHQATLAKELRDYIIDEIVRQLLELYGVDIEESGFVRGVYRPELQRFRKSIHGPLAETDPGTFLVKEVEKLESLISDKARHCLRSLEHLSSARKKQIVLYAF